MVTLKVHDGLYYCKNIKFFQNVEKKTMVALKVHDRNREKLNMIINLFFICILYLDREETGLQPVSIAFNHCVTFLSDFA